MKPRRLEATMARTFPSVELTPWEQGRMSGKRVISWLQKGWALFADPDHEERISQYVSALHRRLITEKDRFNLSSATTELEIDQSEVEEVAEALYRKCLKKAWSDDDLTEKEGRSLDFIGQKLQVPQSKRTALMRAEAGRVFSQQLATAFADGKLDDTEYASLERIARSCGMTAAQFFAAEFQLEGEAFIRNLFLTLLEDGRLDRDEWAQIMLAVKRLGMTEQDFRAAIRAPARQLVEHWLVDAKSDDDISADEESVLNWMVSNLIDDGALVKYVKSEIEATKRLHAIRNGHLPSLVPPANIAIKSGEIVHFVSECIHSYQRPRTGEAVAVRGTAVITDDRFLFVSTEKSQQLIHGKILGFDSLRDGLNVQSGAKGSGLYQFLFDAKAGVEIWKAAIKRANQTLVSPAQERGTRHIPRDVRQRVWQRYGGRCAECSATQYLEYDHIIPVARGGGNSDNNVQLLCRACNLKKSDAI